MSEMNFPTSPFTGMQYNFGGNRYVYDGEKWTTVGVGYNPVNQLRDEVESSIHDLWVRSMAEAGYTFIGTFEEGCTVTTSTDVLLYKAEGKAYSWGGALPKTVLNGSSPADTGGIGASAWVDRSSDFSVISVKHFGAVGDGVSDDTAAIQSAIDSSGYLEFPAGTYRVTSDIVITANKQVNISGKGQGISNIVFENQSGIVANLTGFSVPRQFDITKLSLLSNGTGGTALTINRTSASSIESGINLKDLTICGYEGVHDPDKWFTRAIDINNCRFITLDNVRIWGKENNTSTSSIEGVRIRTTNITQAQFQVFVDKLSIGNFFTGFRIEGNVEGVYWNKSEIFTSRNPLIVDRTGATSAGTVLIAEAHFAGSGNILTFNNVTTVGLNNCEVFLGYAEAGWPYGSSMITIDGSKNTRIIGSKITTSVASTNYNGITMKNSSQCFIGGASIIRGFSKNGIELYNCDDCSIDGVRLIGNDQIGSVGININSNCSLIDIGHAPTTHVQLGLKDTASIASRQYRSYSGTEVHTLIGGSPSEYVDIPIPSDRFSSKPSYVDVSVTSDISTQYLLCSYAYDDAASTATNARIVVRTVDGSNINPAPKRFIFNMLR